MLLQRPRRNRKSPALRALVQETRLHTSDLIAPLFVVEGTKVRQEIPSMPGIYRLSIDELLIEGERACAYGLSALALFPALQRKDDEGSEALNPEGTLNRAVRALKKEFPALAVIADVALDPYTTHGHDGVLNAHGEVCNDSTVEILTQMALLQAEAGVDIVAPSDMMDGTVGAIRRAFEAKGFKNTNILSYTAKYASSFYGPFRQALGSQLRIGDKKGYQLNCANSMEALLEAQLDIDEGADMLMVKPALAYLDIIVRLRQMTTLPIAAYQVSGEYAMLKASAKEGWLNFKNTLYESLIGMKRAGATMIFTYGAFEMADALKSGLCD